jgi:hypothetical protein
MNKTTVALDIQTALRTVVASRTKSYEEYSEEFTKLIEEAEARHIIEHGVKE